MKTTLSLMAALVGIAALTSTAHAQCSAMAPRLSASMPMTAVAIPGGFPNTLTRENKVSEQRGGSSPSAVGLWNVTFVSGGQTVDQAFEVFHSDGTELMVDTAAPASGNVCTGVWAQTDGLSIKLNHPSWTFDNNGNLNGTAIIKTNITLDPNSNKFAGTFTVDVFDLKGNPVFHTGGSVTAIRVEVD